MASDFPSIQPGAVDDLTMQFNGVGASSITAAAWTCSVAPHSPVVDPNPAARLVGVATFLGKSTTHRFANGIEGVIYRLSVVVTLADGRVLPDEADMSCVEGVVGTTPDAALTVEQFRATFPAFANPSFYPDEQVAFWIAQALGTTMNGRPVINPVRWGQFYTLGLRLYVAHNLALDRAAGMQAAAGGSPIGAGVPQSKSVNGVSVSYDVEFGGETDGGNWNLTFWGSRFIRLLREAGAAPIQL